MGREYGKKVACNKVRKRDAIAIAPNRQRCRPLIQNRRKHTFAHVQRNCSAHLFLASRPDNRLTYFPLLLHIKYMVFNAATMCEA